MAPPITMLALDALAPQVPGIGIIALLGVAAIASVVRLLHRRREPAPVAELAGVAVAAHRVGKSFAKDVRIVDDVSFHIMPGRVVGLLGPNGAGKTTLLTLISGLAEPDAGAIYLFGRLVTPGAPVLSRMGVAIEQPGLIPHLTGMQMLQTTWAVTGRAPADAHLDQVAELSGLGKALGQKVGRYSLGMRQRLALAQAMLGLPEVLLLDEPANGLDPNQSRTLRMMLRDYAISGRTVLLSSHVLPEVERMCDEVLIMNHGRLALVASLADMTAPTSVRVTLARHADAEDARHALAERGWACARTADRSLEVTLGDDVPLAEVLQALAEDGRPVRAVHSRSALEEVFDAAVADA